MTGLEAIFLGMVQGATEFLPVSSSGHLVLAQDLLGWGQPDLTFDVWLHFSTLLAVVIFFWKDLLSLTKKEALVILVASIPAALVGLFFEDAISGLFGSTKIVASTLLVTGVFNLITANIIKKRSVEKESSAISFKQGFFVGLFQALAIIPGISRSGSTVLAGSLQGLDRLKAFRFSFMLSLPVILGASSLQFIKVIKSGAISQINADFLFAAVAAFLTGLLSLHVFKYVIKKARLDWFGYYCLILGSGYLLFF
ncbi:MAG: undecaprenyl-diphosphate phosphatase [Candidatus Pacebacteria bacterium]|jgi:undecaprenyl-diphosphatase|nr:undecaprenyl-diphosphate phosphatase [Candidatus Paceibacterota bacterium]MBT3511900.1 undecaprenyl-diphosphate phosphatase [Candidatus Paceibacterota bacterium]MBT4005222.1 undecaprenyl-diphosphate phosphatase [Candidatus Paceibacterota bacterium]MBT4358942.1 undecaprenyl-diphosphate phosphatase [Candidatus Paceibacterota bacterium]MBT4680493.1 undecaprenyl-diphosphate phosphatase [Candidatus Paceibacterota bacterium]